MIILGISAYYHDSAAALLEDGHIKAAAQEERFTRKKHDPGFPVEAIKYCLEQGEFSLRDVGQIVFYDKPLGGRITSKPVLPKFDKRIFNYA
tara:strand:+ start:5297 stop:5572 length:276 start_codon:yes stop_codon:yes gene_type:complete